MPFYERKDCLSKQILSKIILVSFFSTLFTFSLPAAFAATVSLAWDPSSASNVAGYKLHYGPSSRNYPYKVDTGKSTSCSLSGLTAGKKYYFAATAYDPSKVESNFSSEISYTVPTASTTSSGTSGTTFFSSTQPPPPSSGENVTQNAGFESGKNGWTFYTNASGSYNVTGPGDGSSKAAVVTTITRGTNVQLFQKVLTLEPNTTYQLKFSAYSNTGHDLKVSVQKHVAPYTNYGLSSAIANLATSWQSYTFTFTTKNFNNPVNDARLMFWFADNAAPGDQFHIDNVTLSTGSTAPPNSSNNVLQNAGFESGTNGWNFSTNGTGSFTAAGPGDGSAKAAVVAIYTKGTNIQLYQHGITLEPHTTYQLNFSAYSNTGHDFRVSIFKHGAPYTYYGLSPRVVNLANNWRSYTYNFTTKNFNNLVNDARLMLWFADDAAPGDRFRIDDVELIPTN